MLYKNINEFEQVIDKTKRIMCLDFGEKKIGVALSDKTNLIAIPHSVYVRKNTRKDLGSLYGILIENDAGSMVIGLPLDLFGMGNELCDKVMLFANRMIKKYAINIYLHDERYSTAMATRVAKLANIKRKESQKIDDKIAAVLILQQVLDMVKIYQM
ncbi:Holliday junction resolvase [Ehrlichia ruminantium]|uniref:Putative pre-16S rRNA nuclease n=1 Tax=Ehrlichia ruminantium (strain Welgevonden) TaxID=254945 RepID=YQGF_EHRRW|nr:Holliday junction resolvase RuvX [Ehrlichia ruminantium]Q5HAW7.1 RecName: Full=Putative pre-16S rRNA nuclease [Ehrlichia ruminantium str. Welgevonden]KYX00579.1 Holliday junction resolvase [Ehrlichia ruminantium]QLK50641.1 Holliday junction resolvase RuvX [Ehrlichia ruminantium]QLK51566.1 Holliday junction resolvase RuvX [Ehrlichia ruminantium]QLK52489.1 Holliday junction resolvase RuvX [Ehrlichia ruminantium]QLK53401.1 Holliday junction resolvase RuvX [Ehrlichia ruminantium]